MLRRFVPATAVATLVIAGLTGCSAQANKAADCAEVMTSGSLSDSVSVIGSYGTPPEISVKGDFAIADSQRTIVSKAEDRSKLADEQSLVSVNMAFFDETTGAELYASPVFTGQGDSPEFLMVSEELSNPLSEAVRCSAAGDRVVLAMSPEDSAQIAAQLGGTVGASVIGVIDVVDTRGLTASGPVRGLPSGYPAVVTNDEGRPGVVLPPREAPKGTSSATRIVGDGAVVSADNNVIAQVLAVGWDGNKRMNTWDPEDFQNFGLKALQSEDLISQTGYTFRPELTGKTVGSQVVIVENVDGNAQVVVVDIIGVN
ncbi:peptidylprolyl isomerase [Leucobacter insecticola]|uniref:Peptidylprolyl isomerase n=1 Tax=Leucobacter insecticola TaxID=2714934 RepID=A0A6G8FK69_9MICO|nr:peptidylprolyl isomerase [Leucobacter insecticola]QIM16462.1 peptidylprolyl isomerase [Leucobacter insecticola]